MEGKQNPTHYSKDYQPENKGYKFDYDDDEFYDVIFALAYQGLSDDEIADGLAEKFHLSYFSPNTFYCMKNGTYDGWSKEDNSLRSRRILSILGRGRRKVTATCKNRYLKMALGGWKTKNVTTVSRRMRIDGELTDNEDIQTTVTEIESPPNLQALATWLHHHDPEWRKGEGIVLEDLKDDPTAIPTPKKGIDITAWIDKEVQERAEVSKEAEEAAKESLLGDTEELLPIE